MQAQVSDSHDFTLRDVCRATAAAPTYFKPAKIQSVDGSSTAACADGAIVANNPVSVL
jgi:patatin-like phospholipase/acyl hydrolase